MGEWPWRAPHCRAEAALPARRGDTGGGGGLKPPTRLDGAIDSHCHLQHEAFDADRDEVLARAREAGIVRLLVPGYDAASSRAAVALAERHPDLVDAAVGIHPHHVGAATARDWDEVEALARAGGAVAVGEIGLDFFRNLSPRDAQLAGLARQLDLAARLALPVIVHDRDAHAEVREALLAWPGPIGRRHSGVLHCFTGDRALAETLARAGYLISFALPVSFSSARGQREAAAWLPDGSFLVETDSPWLGAGRETRNEPTTVLRVIAELARLRGVEPDAVARDAAAAYRELLAR